MRPKLGTRYLLLGSALSLTMMAMLGGCGAGDRGQAESQPTATNAMAYTVELPPADTPTPVVINGSVIPTARARPTQAPTPAPADDPAMVYVPGGVFIFGSMDKAEESPRQEAQIDGFDIDRRPVTNIDYQAFVQATGAEAPRHWEGGVIPAGREEHPVVWVSWEDANAYCAWAGKRLPTEMEWEKAARGQDGRVYPWGDAFSNANVNSSESGLRDTSPVDRYAAGASPYGAEDMVGNVWEWTADWFDAYRGSLYHMERFGETHKVYRGGSWFDAADSVTTTTRGSGEPTFKFSTLGFRCAR